MKPLNLVLITATATALRIELSNAFQQQTHSSSSPSLYTTARDPFRVVMRSSQFDSASSNDQVIQEEYSKWRRKYGKGEFDAYRYENFKVNFMAVTVRNNMERTRARQNGEAAPSPIALNEFGDCSADEYRNAMGEQQQNSSGLGRAANANSRPAKAMNQGLQPSNTVISSSNNIDLANASAQLREVMQQRMSMENELAEMKKLLAEKKQLLEAATKEEQACQERIALREEQKRLLTDKLNNGWEDEKGLENY
mmetsp:Transcript_4553/g.11741  ORF Transcript_4553/g.11741 Transcript_4553/m.11741 type:complete len:253 (-) Transcript_4553:320-1078(-)|eukprot:CAMPEP_0197175434 /NCGR_PEP_ID=MMETSP1423-20130617/1656_1 /TAXON_ID=476441 /ORGANISM="Pseudo-nitzschia heimii, Strain UNC1101" /LENGTH=252 /DNA_ID=CAMNT_0042624597 /DNA_START=71 /DNA_END=829 /DNA_ORIENTATION=-